MCGISGIIGPRPAQDWRTWAAQTAYRGPDALDVVEQPEALLCHNRLSIIDLSTAANQPMASADGRYLIVFNGEIFNYLELRAELEREGCTFATHSDTEVLLNGYRGWGEKILERLDGMFAFAIWDRAARRLFAARDHAGIKPFFFANSGSSFVFGSEIKLVLSSGVVPPDVRREGVIEYLAYSYVPAPCTAFTQVQSLEPGECLTFDLDGSCLQRRIWWTLPAVDRPVECSDAEAIGRLRELFSASVRRRMISDVPLGAFLSGGVDSSTIVAEMVRHSTGRVKTFAIGYRDNAAYDESAFAAQVAQHLGTEHETIYPEFDAAQLEEYLGRIVHQFDQPYGNPTVILTELLTRNVRDKVTVALVGDGGDELFGGYPRYWALGHQARFHRLIQLARGPALALLGTMPERPGRNHVARRARRFFSSSESEVAMTFEQSTRLFPERQLQACIRPEFAATACGIHLLRDLFRQGGGSWLSRACYTDQRSFLPFNLLEGADRMSMVNSFELRLPFLARDLMEFAAALPPSMRIKGSQQKRVLKDAYRGMLPGGVFDRPKRGFNPPVWHWLKKNLPLLDTLSAPTSPLAEYLRPEAVRAMVDRFRADMEDNSTQLWSLLVLERWLRRPHGAS